MSGFFGMRPKTVLCVREAFSSAELVLWRAEALVPEPRSHHHRLRMAGSDCLSQSPCVIKSSTHLAAPLGRDWHQHAVAGSALWCSKVFGGLG